jgi:hypothetical protein
MKMNQLTKRQRAILLLFEFDDFIYAYPEEKKTIRTLDSLVKRGLLEKSKYYSVDQTDDEFVYKYEKVIKNDNAIG